MVILALEAAVGAGFLVLGSAFLTSISLAIFDFGIVIIILGILVLVSGVGLFRRMGWRRLGEAPALLGEIAFGAILATVPDLLFRSLGAVAVALGILVALYPRTEAGRKYIHGDGPPEEPRPPST